MADGPVPDERDIRIRYTRAGGPGGQHVNKTETVVQLHFALHGHTPLTEPVRERLRALAGRRLNDQDEVVIRAARFRSQDRNREDALARLGALLERAAQPPRPRVPTRPSRAVKRRRLDSKRRQATRKRLRDRPDPSD